MRSTVFAAGLIALVALPATADSTQLAQSVGVEPGVYSTTQLIQLRNLQSEPGTKTAIQKILDNPQGGDLVWRLSTTGEKARTN